MKLKNSTTHLDMGPHRGRSSLVGMECFTRILLFAGILGTTVNAVVPTSGTIATEVYVTFVTEAEEITIMATESALTSEATTIIDVTTEESTDGTLPLTFSINQEYSDDLADSSTAAYKALETKVTTEVDGIGKNLYGADYVSSKVNSFTKGSVVTSMTLRFQNQSVVPTAVAAQEKLSVKLLNSTVLNIVNGTVVVVTTTSSTIAPNATTVMQTAAATEGPSTQAASASEGTLGLRFTMNRTFDSDLTNSASAKFKALSNTVVKAVNKVCKEVYPTSFKRSITNSFTSGSIATEMTLVFADQSSTPAASNATVDLNEKLLASSLNIIRGTVAAYSTSSSGCPAPPATMTLTFLTLMLTFIGRVAL